MRTTIVGLILSFIASQALFAGGTDLSYHYAQPYAGAGSLTITNHGQTAVSIATLMFTSQASIDGNPWGTLFGWQSTLTAVPAEDGLSMHYTIHESPAITIEPAASVVLTYAITQDYHGRFHPYHANMGSTDVKVISTDGPDPLNVAITGACKAAACDDPGAGKVVLGYYPNWAYWRSPKFTADQLQYAKVNHINYAFAIFDNNGQISLYDADSDAFNLPLLAQARKQYPYLNVSLSFGGWSWASTPPGWHCKPGASPQGPAQCFSQLAADPSATDQFVENAVLGMLELGFNGIDIDWEYPNSAIEAKNFITLLSKLHAALEEQTLVTHTHYLLTIAVPAGLDKITVLTADQWQTIAATVDYLGVMTYDFHGSWDQGQTGANFMSAMALNPALDPSYANPILKRYNVIDAMQAYTDRGIVPSKLVVGVPIYGRMVTIESQGEQRGLYQPITGTPQGEWDNQQSGFTGMLDYSCIVDPKTCGNGFKMPPLMLVKYDQTEAMTPWGYGPHLFVTYDDAQSAAYKAQWVLDNQFAGIMFWDLSGDFPDTDDRSILNAVYQVFNHK